MGPEFVLIGTDQRVPGFKILLMNFLHNDIDHFILAESDNGVFYCVNITKTFVKRGIRRFKDLGGQGWVHADQPGEYSKVRIFFNGLGLDFNGLWVKYRQGIFFFNLLLDDFYDAWFLWHGLYDS